LKLIQQGKINIRP